MCLWYKTKVYGYSQEASFYLISPCCRLCTRPAISSFKKTANDPECWEPENYCHLSPRTVSLMLGVTDRN